MIRIGLKQKEKQDILSKYIAEHSLDKIFVFTPKQYPINFDSDVAVEYISYDDIIMYKFFYRLLEEIDDKTLLIFNECLRTSNRSELTYNCAHHYCNQTEHKIVFEYFPFINNDSDFMILLDFINKAKYKNKSFESEFLKTEDIVVKPIKFSLTTIDLSLTSSDIEKYERKKTSLFDNLGNSDPETIPRNLHIWAGNLKKNYIDTTKYYIARNQRFKLPNVDTYKDIKRNDYIVIDFPHRRIDFNDFLKLSDERIIEFINSTLKVDLYYINEFNDWLRRLNKFYAKADLYK